MSSEKPSREEITSMFLGAVGEVLGVEQKKAAAKKPAEPPKKPEPPKKSEPAKAPEAVRVEPEKAAETVSEVGAGTGSLYRDKFARDETRKKIIGEIAQDIYERRMDMKQRKWVKEYEGLELYPHKIHDILIKNNMDPDTDNARKFMEKWDWDQAVQIYERKYGKRATGTGADERAVAHSAATEGIRKVDKDILPEEERDPVKALALHTISKAKNFEELNTDSLGEGDRRIIELTRELWDEFTVHGFPETYALTGETYIAKRTDLDGRGFLALLKKAEIKNLDMEKVEYIDQGQTAESGVVGDTSNEDGVVAKKGGKSLIFDHHGGRSGIDSSATRNMYKAFMDFGLLTKSEALDNFVEFVTKEDNKNYTNKEVEMIIENFEGNLIGLQRYLSGEQMIKVFEAYAEPGEELNPYEKLPDEYLKNLKFTGNTALENVKRKLSNIKAEALAVVQEMEREGFFIITERYGKILIDTGKRKGKSKKISKKLRGGIEIEAARAAGYGGIVFWNPEANSFSIQVAGKDFDFSLPEGFNSRGRYWLKTPSEQKLKVTLEGILGKLAGRDDFQMDESLKQALEKEKPAVSREMSEGQKKLFANLVQKARLAEIQSKFPADESKIHADMKGSWIAKKRSLNNARGYLRDICLKISENKVEIFRDKIMDQVLEKYRELKKEKGKIIETADLREFKKDLLKDLGEDFRGIFGEDVALIVNYFRNMFNVEFLLTRNSR